MNSISYHTQTGYIRHLSPQQHLLILLVHVTYALVPSADEGMNVKIDTYTKAALVVTQIEQSN